jgi:outer membrane protein assembly factor BamD
MVKMGSVTGLAWALLLAVGLQWLAACSSTGEGAYDETRDWSAERLYTEAKEQLLSGDYKKAISYYEKLGARYPYGRYAQQAQLELAYAYYRDKEPAQALATADRFIKLYPDHPNVDYAYYLKGLVNFNEDLGLFGGLANQDMSERDPRGARESFEAFRELVTRFPESRYASDAYARMRYLVNAMANNEVRVATYYLRRQAYIAAANRAQVVLTTYPKTPAVEQALVVLVQSYDVMGLTELRDDAEKMLKLNFPDSKYSLANPFSSKKWYQFW